LTGVKARPYHFPCFSDVPSLVGAPAISRFVLILSLFALYSCATGSASQGELGELKAELRAAREENLRLRRRLEEQDAATPARPGGIGDERPEIPALTVVKLKPKTEPAPKIATAVSVLEPEPDVLEDILQSGSKATEASEEPRSAASPVALELEFQEGITALNTGNLAGGVSRLQKFAAENPRHPKADNALYFSGVGQMGQGNYERAASTFEQVISTYPAGDAVKDSMLKLAECRARLNRRGEARALYTQLLKKYPGTAAATQAQARLASLPP